MGLLDRILKSIFPRQFQPEEEMEPEEISEGEEDVQEDPFRRKIVKASASEQRGAKRTEVFALTYENNAVDRFEELSEEIRRYSETQRLFFAGEFGYDDQQISNTAPFVYPQIEVGEE